MALRYCFEQSKVRCTLSASRKNDLAVIDTDGINAAAIKAACACGVWVYGYLNISALEKQRNYYSQFKHLRIANMTGGTGNTR